MDPDIFIAHFDNNNIKTVVDLHNETIFEDSARICWKDFRGHWQSLGGNR